MANEMCNLQSTSCVCVIWMGATHERAVKLTGRKSLSFVAIIWLDYAFASHQPIGGGVLLGESRHSQQRVLDVYRTSIYCLEHEAAP